MMSKIKVAVLFGGQSPEHEVSIITGIQVMNALDKSKYEVVPIYVTKDGRWVRGDNSFLLPATFKNLEAAVSRKQTIIFSSDPTKPGFVVESPRLSFSKAFLTEEID